MSRMRNLVGGMLFGLLVLAIIFLAMARIVGPASRHAQPSPFAQILGSHGDFTIVGAGIDEVHVTINMRDPRRYCKALKDALDLIEKTSGRKVATVQVNGYPAKVSFGLEPEKKH